jgi:hypothetical protein
MAARALGERDVAQPRRDARGQPGQVADAALDAILVRQRIQAVPVTLAQHGRQQQAVAEFAQAGRADRGLRQPDGQLQVLAAFFDQPGALARDELPVRFLQLRDPRALLQRRIVGLARAHDGVDLAGKREIVAAGLVGADGRQQPFQVQHRRLLTPVRRRT